MNRARNFQLDIPSVKPLTYARTKQLTRLFNSLSLLFPNGERFFCEAVRPYREQVSDDLKQEIKVFIQEEANHSNQHRKLNKILKDLGYDTDHMEEDAKKMLHILGKDDELRLMVTVSLEIFTAYGADFLLLFRKLLLRNTEASKLWIYHAIEESGHGHRSVASKVLKSVNPRYSKTKLAAVFVASMALLARQTTKNYLMLSKTV